VVGGSNGAISGSIISKMAADGHLGMTALSRVTLASAGLFLLFCVSVSMAAPGKEILLTAQTFDSIAYTEEVRRCLNNKIIPRNTSIEMSNVKLQMSRLIA